MPKAAARIANPEFALRVKAPLPEPVEVEAGAEPVELPVLLPDPVPVGEVALGLGAPKALTPLPTGPGAADAEAPTPTNAPTVGWPGVPEETSAALWNLAKVLPVALVGALMAPTMPEKQCGLGRSCLQ